MAALPDEVLLEPNLIENRRVDRRLTSRLRALPLGAEDASSILEAAAYAELTRRDTVRRREAAAQQRQEEAARLAAERAAEAERAQAARQQSGRPSRRRSRHG